MLNRCELPPEELCPFDTPSLLEVDKAKAVAEAPVRARPTPPAAPLPGGAVTRAARRACPTALWCWKVCRALA